MAADDGKRGKRIRLHEAVVDLVLYATRQLKDEPSVAAVERNLEPLLARLYFDALAAMPDGYNGAAVRNGRRGGSK